MGVREPSRLTAFVGPAVSRQVHLSEVGPWICFDRAGPSEMVVRPRQFVFVQAIFRERERSDVRLEMGSDLLSR